MQLYKKNLLYQSLKKLVKQTKLVQKKLFTSCQSSLDDRPLRFRSKSFLKEYGTVKLCAARRSGHSFALSKFALKEANKGKKVLVLNWNLDQSNRCRETIKKSCEEKLIKINKCNSCTIELEEGRIMFGAQSQAKANGFSSLHYDADLILVDVSSMWSKSSIEMIYDRLGPCLTFTKYPMIIFLE
jgi:hypothetical protein